MAKLAAKSLVAELLANPARFNEQGRAYQLLQGYFHGYPLETLRPLLAHEDELVQRAAIWIVSELGEQGCTLLHDVVPLMNSGNRYIRYHALEVAIVCAIGEDVDEFTHVARALQSDDDVIRGLAMRLVANADPSQLEAGLRLTGTALGEAHRKGLQQLSRGDSLKPEEVSEMIVADDSLTRRYGAIAAKRLSRRYPELIVSAESSVDPDVRRLANDRIES